MQIKVILTGATGFVGQGVLLECLQNKDVSEVLMINRRHLEQSHPKLKELIVPDFMSLEKYTAQLQGYDACFFCAGISSLGMSEPKYTQITFDTTVHVAKVLLDANPGSTFIYVSGAGTDSSEKGRLMWARVKGHTENTLAAMGFKKQYNFRPGFMSPMPGQQHVKTIYKVLAPAAKIFWPKMYATVQQVGQAMINATIDGYSKNILEVSDIKTLAKSQS
ncbi:NAD-dependent epimerase/dehydratase family protein [Chitinophaga sp. Cy-1792]|uniref:NAD-dependent epimerase/dehydratase family protein n=1 Tax=Chitinophaga sp. Cy-1792 TaxID=2608339 RepID=UPI00141D8BCF|nr:NAD-dependent epimerase/dehydratase family protein [Chitinophaga sp. Cy-1792]NIG54101.1 NAD(P)H-binding protein [Chitinophaga sp. Cy-1792]